MPTKLHAGTWLSITQVTAHIFTNMQTRHWIFTLNNWTQEDDDALKALGPEVTYLVYGYETSETGTPHLQGYVVFPRVKRFNEARSLLPGTPHLEAKRGSPAQAAEYCKKDGVFQEFGVCPQGRVGVSQFDGFIEWVLSRQGELGYVPGDREIARQFPHLWLRHERKLRSLAQHLSPPPALMEPPELQEWQVALRDVLVAQPPDDRTILFYVDAEGGRGKSFFQKYMVTFHSDDVQILGLGKREDIAFAIDETKTVFLFNVPRGSMEYLNYSILEQIKDRMIFSSKYESGTKIIRANPHVVVFANEFPDMTKLTLDRYSVINMVNL